MSPYRSFTRDDTLERQVVQETNEDFNPCLVEYLIREDDGSARGTWVGTI